MCISTIKLSKNYIYKKKNRFNTRLWSWFKSTHLMSSQSIIHFLHLNEWAQHLLFGEWSILPHILTLIFSLVMYSWYRYENKNYYNNHYIKCSMKMEIEVAKRWATNPLWSLLNQERIDLVKQQKAIKLPEKEKYQTNRERTVH